MTDTATPDSNSSTAAGEARWSDHVRLLMYAAFLPAIAFLGPLVAIAVFAVVWILLPDSDTAETRA